MNYCPQCGLKLIQSVVDNTSVKVCQSCGYIDWNNWVNVACMVVANYQDKGYVMVKLKGKESGKITFPGGYRNLGESLEAAAKREFYEETGMEALNVTLYKTFTKDEQRLVWVVFKADVSEWRFMENDETSEVILVSKKEEIPYHHLRGPLTVQLANNLWDNPQ